MIKRFEFVDKTIAIIREKLENNLPSEATLEDMVAKRDKLLKQVMHKEVN
jgi:hypothetical protein